MVLAICAVLLWELIKTGQQSQQSPEISYSQFLSQVDVGNVASVLISGNRIEGKYRESGGFIVNGPANQDAMIATLRQKNVDVRYTENHPRGLLAMLATWAPFIMLAALWLLMIWQMKLKRQASRQSNTQNTPPPIDNRWSSK